jgi:hypothetical protein
MRLRWEAFKGEHSVVMHPDAGHIKPALRCTDATCSHHPSSLIATLDMATHVVLERS